MSYFLMEWHRWYAWHPVKLGDFTHIRSFGDAEWTWLTWVERQEVYRYRHVYQYRRIK